MVFLAGVILTTIFVLIIIKTYEVLCVTNIDNIALLYDKLEEKIRLLSQRVLKLESDLMHLRLR